MPQLRYFRERIDEDDHPQVRENFRSARMEVSFRDYIASAVTNSVILFVVLSGIFFFAFSFLLNQPLLYSIPLSIGAGGITGFAIYRLFLYYPRLKAINREKEIVWKYSSKNPAAIWLKMPFKMKNAGAEKLDESMMPFGWRVCDMIAPDAGIWSVDKNVRYEGENSFKISGKGNYGINKFWGQYIKNIGGKKIKISFMIKTKDVKQGAGVSINFVDFKGGIIGGVNSKTFKGDNKWTEILILTQVPQKTAVIGVTLSLVGPGTAWWDAGKMEKL